MKGKLKLLCISAILFVNIAKPQSVKKMSGSLGISFLPEIGLGHDLQFSYALSNKLSLSFQSLSLIEFPDKGSSTYTNSGPPSRSYTVNDNWKSTYMGFNLNARYYFKGDNTPDCNFSFYGGAGVGIMHQSYSNSFTTDLSSSDTLYFNNEYSGKNLVLGPSAILGIDKKLGPGKIYLDITVMYGVLYWNSYSDKFYSVRNGSSTFNGKYSGSYTDGEIYYPVSLGYRITF